MLTITLLGTAATMPLPERALTAAVAECGGHSLLLDCGEGTQTAARRAGVNLMRADAICLTHYHGDHIFGLPGLLQTLGAQGRTRPLALLGPEDLPDIWAAVRALTGPLPYPVKPQVLMPGQPLALDALSEGWPAGARLVPFATKHRVKSLGYRLELPRRPVLEALRFAHADYFFAIQYKLSRQEWMAKNQLVYSMQAARWRAVQGRTPPVLTPYEKNLDAALSPETPPKPDELKAALLAVYAKFELFNGTVHQKAGLHLHLDGLLASLMTRTMPTQMIKTDRVTVEHSGSVDASGSGIHADKRLAHITLRQRAEEDRAYIESCFGRSLYPPERLRKAEQELCTGEHLGCHLWFASGVPSPEQAPTPEAKHLAEQAQLQAERNRAYYSKNLELHRSVVLRLTEQIRNCILVHQQPNARVARSGNLDPERVWRTVMDDDRVFRCAEEENHPSFTVDLLLDASASRLHCQEVIAAQGSILAQSLAACGIPVRVSAFSSLRGYTVLRVLKHFKDKQWQGVNQYFASGWNRDGLALRAAGDLLDFDPGPAPRHLLILLTDASPNDSRRIPPTAQNPLGCAYEDAAGVADTAAQVRTLQRQGVRVSAVFMGEDSSAGAATQIYGKNMARIRGMDQLARAAGRLIQNEIRELGD